MEAVLPVVGSETCKCCAVRLDYLLIMHCSSSDGGKPNSAAQHNICHHCDHRLFMPSPCPNIWSSAISLAALKHRNSNSHVTSKKRTKNTSENVKKMIRSE
jgi:hypothetical protein